MILKTHVNKDILGHYVDNLNDFNNLTREYDRKKIKSEGFNKWMAYL